MNLTKEFAVKPGRKARLADWDPSYTAGFKSKSAARDAVAKNVARLDELQYLLYAEGARSLLIVFQGMDAAGKDGTIRHVMSGVNPQGCAVTSFKVPSAEEKSHDFLWRIHKAVPPKGYIGIFNRSHYEDVLVVRVHKLVPKSVWSARYDEINDFERELAESGVTTLKFFLHISAAEQKRRFEERLADPTRHWKLSPADFAERQYWKDYTDAYEDALSRCTTDWAPWFVIPSDRKWFRNLAVSRIIVETLEGLDMKFPKPSFDVSKLVVK